MHFNVVTLFPQMIEAAAKTGVVGQAITRGEIALATVNPRTWTSDVHHTVDDRPYGGGDGMVMMIEPLHSAMESLGAHAGHRVYLSAHGQKWSDEKARIWATKHETVTLVCGRYGGVDQRFINRHIDEEISVGDYILSGGELAALVVIDTMARFKPAVLGNSLSASNESFADGLLEAPQFTRPREFLNTAVPPVFMSGDHARVRAAQRALSIMITFERRPDLLREIHKIELSKARDLLKGFTKEELQACGLGEKALKFIDHAN